MDKKKKKKSKKDEEMERLLREEEAERERLEAERKAKIEKERKERAAKVERERREQNKRDESLFATIRMFEEMALKKLESDVEKRKERQWLRYIACDGLPRPESVKEMNTHLYAWENSLGEEGSRILPKVREILELLEGLEELIEDPLDAPKFLIDNWKEVRSNYRKTLENRLDMSNFKTLRDIKGKMNRTDYYNASLTFENVDLSIGLWTWLDVPVSSTDGRKPPFVSFENVGLSTQLPPPFEKEFTVVRLMRLNYNHYNDRCKSYEMAQLSKEYCLDLYKVMKKRWDDIEALRNKAQEESKPKSVKKPWWMTGEMDYKEGSIASRDNLQSFVQSETEMKVEEEVQNERKKEDGALEKNLGEEEVEEIGIKKNELEQDNEDDSRQEKLSKEGFIVPMETPTGSSEQVPFFELNLDEEQQEMRKIVAALLQSGEKIPHEIETKLTPLDLDTLIELHELKDVVEAVTQVRDGKTGQKGKKAKKAKPLEKEKEEVEIFRTPSEIVLSSEEEAWGVAASLLSVSVQPGELNMRSHNVIGGVFRVDLIMQPPQDFIDQSLCRLTILYGELGLLKREYSCVYIPPAVESETKEGEDGEGRGTEGKKGEGNLESLILINVMLTSDALWFDPPKPVLWREGDSCWSENDIYDSKFNEEKQILSFRVGRISPIGLSVYRFSNLPFQTWELRPLDSDNPSDIFFTITCNTVIVEFLIRNDEVKLHKLQNVTGNALEAVIGHWLPPRELRRKMRSRGLDIFPERDSFLYVEGSAPKCPPAEDHLYHCMALVSLAYGFTWSRWNLLAGRNSMVIQMKEIRPKNLPVANYSTLLVKPDRTIIVDCNEVSPSFTEQGIAGMGFYPDLHSLIFETGSELAKISLEEIPINLVETLYFLLRSTKVLSYS